MHVLQITQLSVVLKSQLIFKRFACFACFLSTTAIRIIDAGKKQSYYYFVEKNETFQLLFFKTKRA